MLTVGDKFPEFDLPVQQGVAALPAGERLSSNDPSLQGKWKIVFYWPKDFTFICPTEIIGYGELAHDFKDRDAVLIGASLDTDFVHFAWRKSDERLARADFPWLADNTHALASALGIIDKANGVTFRATFVVDPHDVIQHVTVNADSVGRNPHEALRTLDALQTDELCPCNWQAGAETLHPTA